MQLKIKAGPFLLSILGNVLHISVKGTKLKIDSLIGRLGLPRGLLFSKTSSHAETENKFSTSLYALC